MKDYDKVYKLIREHHTVHARPRLTAEFNYNRYAGPIASNTPAINEDSQDPDLFPIESIVEGRRPGAGIITARVDEWIVDDDYEITNDTERYYIADESDVYKYWSGPDLANGSGNFPAGSDIYPTNINPQVVYNRDVKSNKIVIGFENTYASPVDYEIYVKNSTSGGWVKVADSVDNSLTIDGDGRLILYYNGTSWGQTPSFGSFTAVSGIQLRVNSMSKPNSFFNLIEISARLQRDLTSYLMSVSDVFDLGEVSSLRPIGDATSQVADIKLFNHYDNGFIFNDDNPNSLYAGLMEENVKFVLDYIYDTSDVGGTEVPIRQFEMYSTGHWSAQGVQETNVSLRDSSKFLQETKCQSLFYENRTVTSIIFRLLDSIGFDQYDIGKSRMHKVGGVWTETTTDIDPLIVPYFWANPEETVWDTIQNLASGTQTAIYFDEWDRLQILTRRQAFANLSGDVWTLRGNTSGPELTDIVEYSLDESDVTNSVTVNYRTTEFEEYVSGVRKNDIVWQPEDETVYVKSSPLSKDLSPSDMTMWLTPAEAALWPFESMMAIEAEIIKYKGKEFTYYPADSNDPVVVTNSATTVWLETYDDYKNFHFDKTPTKNRYLNKFTGKLKITERGTWNTPASSHIVDTTSTWTQKNVRGTVSYVDKNGFFKNEATLTTYRDKYLTAQKKYKKKKTKKNKKAYNAASAAYKAFEALYEQYKNAAVTDGIEIPAEKSTIQMIANANYTSDHYLMCVRGNAATDLGYKHYGTRLRFNTDSALTDAAAGVYLMGENSADVGGYYVEFSPKGGKSGVGTIRVYRRDTSGKRKYEKKKDTIVLYDKWYTLDITVTGDETTSNFVIRVYIDGLLVLTTDDLKDSNKIYYTGRFGLFSRAKTNVSFEYIYAIGAYESMAEWPDNFAKWDRLTGAFSSSRFTSWVADQEDMYFKRKIKKKTYVDTLLKYTHFIFDEFGPLCHEIREFNVKYDSSSMPVMAPYVYWTNTGMSDLYDVNPGAFGSKIYMINTAREDAALQGTDDGHQFCVYGLVLKQRDSQSIEVKNDASIVMIGNKELTIESPWIQSKDAAEGLGSWITSHWADATDSLYVSIFGNCLIQIGDIVSVSIADANITPGTHRYFVVSTETAFADGGMETTLRLRRAKN